MSCDTLAYQMLEKYSIILLRPNKFKTKLIDGKNGSRNHYLNHFILKFGMTLLETELFWVIQKHVNIIEP